MLHLTFTVPGAVVMLLVILQLITSGISFGYHAKDDSAPPLALVTFGLALVEFGAIVQAVV